MRRPRGRPPSKKAQAGAGGSGGGADSAAVDTAMLVEGCARLRQQFVDAHRILQFVLAREHLKRDLVRRTHTHTLIRIRTFIL